MKRAWTRGEKWLWAAPLLFGALAVAAKFGPDAARRAMSYPKVLSATPGNMLTSLALSRDGRVLVAGEQIIKPSKTASNTIYLWDARTLSPLKSLPGPLRASPDGFRGVTYGIALSPNTKLLAVIDPGVILSVFDLNTRRILWTTTNFAEDADFSPDGRFLAVGSSKLRILDARTGKMMTSWKPRPDRGGVALKFSSQGRYFASTGGQPPFKQWEKSPNDVGGEIELRRVSDWKIERVFPLPNSDRIAFSPDEKTIVGVAHLLRPSAFGYSGSRMRCFDTSSGKLKWEFDAPNKNADFRARSIEDVCFSPDGLMIAVLAPDRRVFLFDALTGEVRRTLPISAAQEPNCTLPHGLLFSPDGKRLFARGKSAVLVWDLK